MNRKLSADVAAAVERLSRPGIDRWGLHVCEGMAAAGEMMDLGAHRGCTSNTCSHWDHSPAAPMRRWVPRSGYVVELGCDMKPDETEVAWFAHILDDGEDVRYVKLVKVQGYWASARYVESVPDWVLAHLAEGDAV